ncbi:Glycoside hydrolase family 18 catalytic domain [Trinorchestia longiramus]|nr:Glycoside hydrolase family 18 catalytic domain [Trinorchestia longiramus]
MLFIVYFMLSGVDCATAVPDKSVVCYHGTWSTYRPEDGKFDIEDIDPFLCTHAIYAFAAINADTFEVEAFDPSLDIDLLGFNRFVALKEQNPELKVLLAVGGGSDSSDKYSEMVSTSSNRDAFTQSAVFFLKTYSFDGFDLDWEYPANNVDKENFATLVSEMREEFDKSGLLLTSTVGLGYNVLHTSYDFTSLCANLDFINLMAYDLYGPWDGFTGHHTSLHAHPNLGSTSYGLTEALEQVKLLGGCLEKMVLGMGMYGKTYTLVDQEMTDIGSPTAGAGAAGLYTQENGTLGFNEICLKLNYQQDIDNYTMAPWAYDGFHWVCYDDVKSIEYKSEWVLQNGLLGAMIWSIDTDDFRGTCGLGNYPLLSQINKSLRPAATTNKALSSIISSLNSPHSTTMKPARAVSPEERNIVCYLGTWSYYRLDDGKFEIENIDPFLCTHVIYAFATMNESTYEMQEFDSWLDIELGGYQKFVALKEQNPDLKVLLAVGGWSDGSEKYSNMVSSQASRDTFVQSALSFIQQYSFDGLDLDWEYPANRGGKPEDKFNFALLVSELRNAFDGSGFLLTSAIGLGADILETAYDFESLCENLDFINLMAYDFHGPWEDFTGHHTSMHAHPKLGDLGYGLTEALNLVEELGGCLNKMVLGMGTYGKSYTLQYEQLTDIGSPTVGPGTSGPYTAENGTLGYNEICLNSNYEQDIDDYTMAPWLFDGFQWVCYDDVESIKYKSEWALENGLLGGMIWSLETDDFRGTCGQGRYPLLSQINKSIRPAAATNTATVPVTTNQPSNSTSSLTTSFPSVYERKIVCYLGSWSYYRLDDGKFEVENIDPFLCTHAIYAFATMNESTYEMQVFDSWLDIELEGYQKFVALKEQNPDLKVLLAIGGWSDGSEKYSNMVSSQASRDTFVQSALSFIKRYSFDGLDLDWEYPANRGAACDTYITFLQAFDGSGLLLTSAIGIGQDVLESAYDFESLCENLDFFNLMAYDLHGSWESFTGHHTSLHAHPALGESDYGLTEALELLKSLGGCLNKMVLGMGTYGKSYTLADEQLTDIGAPVTGAGNEGQYTQESCEWALENCMIGGMIWSLETDDFRGSCGGGTYPLLNQINNSIRSVPNITQPITSSTTTTTTISTENSSPDTSTETTSPTTTTVKTTVDLTESSSMSTSATTISTENSSPDTSTETTSQTTTTVKTTVDLTESSSTSTSATQSSSNPSTTTPRATTPEVTETTENSAKPVTLTSFFGLLIVSLILVLMHEKYILQIG